MSTLAEVLHLERPLLIFDCETTGPTPEQDRIVELGLLLLKPDASVVEYGTFVNPGIPIPHEATYGNPERDYPGHGITDEMVANAPKFASLAPHLLRAFTPETDYAGFNHKRFDLPLLREEFKRNGHLWNYDQARILDAHRIWQLVQKRSLSDACEMFLGRKHEGAHRAIDDVRVTAEILLAQILKHDTLPKDVQALHALQYPVDPNAIDPEGKLMWKDGHATMNFGKNWKGKRLDMMTQRDLRWIVSPACAGASTIVKAICAEALEGRFPVQDTQPNAIQ